MFFQAFIQKRVQNYNGGNPTAQKDSKDSKQASRFYSLNGNYHHFFLQTTASGICWLLCVIAECRSDCLALY